MAIFLAGGRSGLFGMLEQGATGWRGRDCVAVREGFEPSIGVNLYTLSKRAPSTARPPHQLAEGRQYSDGDAGDNRFAKALTISLRRPYVGEGEFH